jgi:hypothetical protein
MPITNFLTNIFSRSEMLGGRVLRIMNPATILVCGSWEKYPQLCPGRSGGLVTDESVEFEK